MTKSGWRKTNNEPQNNLRACVFKDTVCSEFIKALFGLRSKVDITCIMLRFLVSYAIQAFLPDTHTLPLILPLSRFHPIIPVK